MTTSVQDVDVAVADEARDALVERLFGSVPV